MRRWVVAMGIAAGVLLLGLEPQARRGPARSASDEQPGIHVLGHVNVNRASADELAQVPGLRPADVARILKAREKGPLSSLDGLHLPSQALRYLSTDGPSDFSRIRKPLEAVGQSGS